MPKFRVSGTLTISVYIDVEAEDEDAAKEVARQEGVQGLCWQCARGEEGVWCTSGELDGEPEINEDDDIVLLED